MEGGGQARPKKAAARGAQREGRKHLVLSLTRLSDWRHAEKKKW